MVQTDQKPDLTGAADGVVIPPEKESVFTRLLNRTPEQAEADRAAAIERFWQANNKGLPLIPEDIQATIEQNGETVVIHVIRDGTSKFGPTWFTDIERANGERWCCPQSHNQVRDPLMLNLQRFVSEYGPMPVSMVGFDTDLGHGWDFAAPLPDALTSGI